MTSKTRAREWYICPKDGIVVPFSRKLWNPQRFGVDCHLGHIAHFMIHVREVLPKRRYYNGLREMKKGKRK